MTLKPAPYRAFRDHMEDAEALLRYAIAFKDQRSRRMRPELRDRVGQALNIPKRDRDKLDRLQSGDMFVVFTPNGNLSREHFRDLRPLLRQSLVAACAALETYVADKAVELLVPLLATDILERDMKAIQLTVGEWHSIERGYRRRGWGIRKIVDESHT